MMRAWRTASGVRPPHSSFGSQTTISSSGTPILKAVLRPRCWSGRNRIFSPRSHAHFNVAAAFDDVQTTPPRSPTKDLIAADELMYVTGITDAPAPESDRALAGTSA